MTCFHRGSHFLLRLLYLTYLCMSAERNVLVLARVVHSLSIPKGFFLMIFGSIYATTKHISSLLALVISARVPPASHYSSVVISPVHALHGVHGVHSMHHFSSHDVLMFAMPIRASILRRRRASVAVTLPRVTLVFTKEARRKRLMLALISEAERSGAWRSAIKASKSARNCGIGCARRNSSRCFHSLLTSRKSVSNVLQHNARSRVEVLGLGTKRSLSSRTRSRMCC